MDDSTDTQSNTQIKIGLQCRPTLNSEPLLVCGEGFIRKKRLGLTNKRRQRRFVLLKNVPQQQQQEPIIGGLLPGRQDALMRHCEEVRVVVPYGPLLILHKMDESDCCPTAIIPLRQQPQQRTDNVDDGDDEGYVFTVERVPDKPFHLQIIVRAPKSLPMVRGLFDGRDDGIEYNWSDDGNDRDSDTHLVRYWKLKFPSEETALLWYDSMQELAEIDDAVVAPIAEAITDDADTTSSTEASSSVEALDDIATGTTTATTSENTTEDRTSKTLVHLMIIFVAVYLIFALFFPSGGGKKDKVAATLTNTHPSDCEFDCSPVARPKRKRRFESFVPVDEQQPIEEDHPINPIEQLSSLFGSVMLSLKRTATYIIWSPRNIREERPAIEQTYLRKVLLLTKRNYKLHEVFLPGSFFRDYFWLCFPAICVLLVSISSIICRVFPRLGTTVWHARYWGAAFLSLSAAICLGHDTYMNHWRYPLDYGLYWTGHMQGIVVLGCLGVARFFTKRALGIPLRRTISMARKVSSGLGALQASLVLPLSLRAVQEQNHDDNTACFQFAAFAFVNFFTGLYFFGRARREMIVYGIAVGEKIYNFSLLPANTAYAILGGLGEIVGSKFLVPLGKEILRVSKLVWNKLEYYFRYEHLKKAIKYVYEKYIDPTYCFILRVMDSLCDVIWKVLGTLKKWIRPVLRFVLEFSESFINFMQKIAAKLYNMIVVCLDTAMSLLRKFVSWLSDVYNAVKDPIVAVMQKIATKLYDMIVVCLDTAISLLQKFASWLLEVIGSIYSAIKDPLIKICSFVIEKTFYVLRTTFETLRSIVGQTCSTLKSGCTFIYDKTVPLLYAFVKKYWQFIPAGLSFNGSFLFARIAIITKESAHVRLNYILGSWALLLIGCSVTHAILSSPGNLVHQKIEINNSFLRYIDLYFFSAVWQIATSGYRVLSVLLKMVLHSLDLIIRETSKQIWKLLGLIHDGITMPLMRSFASVMRYIWKSPYFSSFLSFGALLILYLHHLGKIAIGGEDFRAGAQASYHLLFVSLPDKCNEAYHSLSPFLISSLSMLARIYGDVYGPLLESDTPSDLAGLCCWIFTCIIAKTRDRVRIKTFAIPVVVFYFTSATTAELVKASAVSLFIWFVLSLIVDLHEHRQTELAEAAFVDFQQQRRPPPQSRIEEKQPNLESKIGAGFDQAECCICLDEFEHGKSEVAELPCGHQFHSSCIHEWVDTSNVARCPLCRRAMGGWDRVFEVIF